MGRPTVAVTSPGRLTRVGTAAWALLGIVVLILFAGWAVGKLMPVVLPFAVAVLLATLLRPLADRLEARGARPAAGRDHRRARLAVLVLVRADRADPAAVHRPAHRPRFERAGGRRSGSPTRSARASRGWTARTSTACSTTAADRLRERAGGMPATAGLSSLPARSPSVVLVAFLCFFLVKDGRRLWVWAVELAPESRRDAIDEVGERAWTSLTAYTRGVVFVATVDAVLIGAVLLLVGVPLALPLIVLTWLAAFFPIIGAIVAGAAAVLVALVTGGSTDALIVLAAIVVVQQVEGNVLYPVVIGPRLKLHPIVVLVAVAAGGTIAGIAGAFLAVPVATVCGALLAFHRERRSLREDAAVPPPRRGVLVESG